MLGFRLARGDCRKVGRRVRRLAVRGGLLRGLSWSWVDGAVSSEADRKIDLREGRRQHPRRLRTGMSGWGRSGGTPEIPTPGRWMFRHPGEVIHGDKAKELPTRVQTGRSGPGAFREGPHPHRHTPESGHPSGDAAELTTPSEWPTPAGTRQVMRSSTPTTDRNTHLTQSARLWPSWTSGKSPAAPAHASTTRPRRASSPYSNPRSAPGSGRPGHRLGRTYSNGSRSITTERGSTRPSATSPPPPGKSRYRQRLDLAA
jgi:hypothetical protein